jgi:hypothetical protein
MSGFGVPWCILLAGGPSQRLGSMSRRSDETRHGKSNCAIHPEVSVTFFLKHKACETPKNLRVGGLLLFLCL